MNWILLVMGAIVSVVAAVLVGGSMLPAAYEAKRVLRLTAGAADVQGSLRGVADWPVWMELTRTPQIERDEPSSIVVGMTNDDQQRVGTLQFALASRDGGTVVTATDKGTVSNPVSRLLRHYALGQHATVDAVLRALAEQLGESVEFVDA